MKAGKVLAGARIKFAGTALSKLLMFLFALYLARRLGVAAFGKFTFAFAYSSLWAIVMDLGLSVAVMREFAVSMERGKASLKGAMTLKGVTIFAGVGGMVLVMPFLHLSADTATLTLFMGVGMALDTYARIASGIFRAREDMASDALVTLIQKAVFVGLGAGLVAAGVELAYVGGAFVAGYVAALVWSRRVLANRHAVRVFFGFDPALMKKLLAVAVPLALVDFFTLIYFRIDTVMLEAMSGDEAVGLYNAAYRLIEAAMIFPMAFLAAAFAGFARDWESDRLGLLKDYCRSMEWMMAIAAPGVAVGFVLAPGIVYGLFGEQFMQSAPDLRILLIALLAIYPNYVLTQILIACGQQKTYALYVGACAGFNIAANGLLIPLLGHSGAALATVGTEVLLFVLCFRHVSRLVGTIPLKKIGAIVYWSAFLAACCWGAGKLWSSLGWIVAILGILAVMQYGIGLRRLLIGNAPDEDRH